MFEHLIKIIKMTDVSVIKTNNIEEHKDSITDGFKKSITLNKNREIEKGYSKARLSDEVRSDLENFAFGTVIIDNVESFSKNPQPLMEIIDIAFISGKRIVLLTNDLEILNEIKLVNFCDKHELELVAIIHDGIDEDGNEYGFKINYQKLS